MRSLTLAVVACLTTSACPTGDEISPAFVRESQRAQPATVPAGITARISPAQSEAMTISQRWLVPLEMDWSKYLDGAVRELEPAFRCPEPGSGEMACSRSMPGDYLTLTVTLLETEAGRSVRVRLEARPD